MPVTLELTPAHAALLLDLAERHGRDLAERHGRDLEEYASFLVTAALRQHYAEPVSHEEETPAAEAAG